LLRYCDFSIFQDGGRRHLGFSILEILTVESVKRAKMRHLQNFVSIGQTVAQIWRFFIFLKMAASAILRFKM